MLLILFIVLFSYTVIKQVTIRSTDFGGGGCYKADELTNGVGGRHKKFKNPWSRGVSASKAICACLEQ
jgi:hypothetical protein